MNPYLANGTLLILLATFTISPHLCAAASGYEEDEIKVVLIYHFTKFIDWPPLALGDANAEFMLCIFGTRPSENALKAIRGKLVKGRSLAIRHVSYLAQLNTCHTLFINTSGVASAAVVTNRILTHVKTLPIVTISDLTGFVHMGGMFNFVRAKDTIGFDVNPSAARRVGLTIRSKLLRLAINVVEIDVNR